MVKFLYSFLAIVVGVIVGRECVLGQLQVRVRLVPAFESTGRLEANITILGWTPFAIDGFSMQIADLSCKSLGFLYAERYSTVGSVGLLEASTTASITGVGCLDFETYISGCNFRSTPGYPHYRDVAVACTNGPSQLRLVSNSGSTVGVSSGRLEINVNNTWGTVCNQFFVGNQATLACRQLGFEQFLDFNSVDQIPSFTATTTAPIWLYRFSGCDSDRTDLRLCSFNLGDTGCDHNNDIILFCENIDNSTSSTAPSAIPPYEISSDSDTVRLVDRNGYLGSSEGRVEIYYSSSDGYAWTPFCYIYFDEDTANKICRQLGYSGYLTYDTVQSLGYAEGSGPVSISALNNCGSRVSYYSCSITTTTTCSHANDVVLSCSDSKTALVLALSVGLSVGLLVCCTCICVGVLLCAVIGGVVYHQNHSNNTKSPRTTTAVRYNPQGNSGAIINNTTGPEPGYFPTVPTQTVQPNQPNQPNPPVQSSTTVTPSVDKDEDGFENITSNNEGEIDLDVTGNDEQPLIAEL